MPGRRPYGLITAFITPALVLYVVFVAYPYLQGVLKSLTAWSGLSGKAEFIGLENYLGLLRDEVFLQSVRTSLTLAVLTIGPIFGLALFIAVMLARPGRLAAFLRAVAVLPLLLSLPTVAVLARQAFQVDWGFVNSGLRAVGLSQLERAWLGDADLALFAVAAAWIWFATSFYVLIFYAGIQNIPDDLYAAARVDGATTFQLLRYITVPLLWDVLRVSVVFFVVGLFVFSFPLIHVMTDGGPSHTTEIMASWLYKEAFVSSKFGYASTIGVAILALALLLSLTSARLMRRETVEY